MMLAISEYVHDYSGCGDKDLSLGKDLSLDKDPALSLILRSPAEPLS